MRKFLIYDFILLLILILVFIGLFTDIIILHIVDIFYAMTGGYVSLFALTILLLVYVKEILDNGFNKQNSFYYGSAIFLTIVFAACSFVFPLIPSIQK